jgi:capsular polysaccharide transport system permease protein
LTFDNSISAITHDLRMRAKIIGALILRELHTRFGRENFGYLWIFLEPILLAAAVAALHGNYQLPISGGVQPIPFALSGYILFIMFRSVVSRAETLLEANRPLLYHRPISLFDMLLARSLLELVSTYTVLFLLLTAAWLLGFGEPVFDPLLVMLAIFLMAWLCLGMAMLVMALSHQSAFFGRLIHPLLYLTLPISGAFYILEWLPAPVRHWASYVPTVHIFELMREGQFAHFESVGLDVVYPVICSAVLMLLGYLAIAYVRPKIELT